MKPPQKSRPRSKKAFGITILNGSDPRIRRLKRSNFQPTIHGNKFWKSSLLLMDYFRKNNLPRGSRVIEAGCGWGLAGIYLAKKFEASVSSVDADSDVFPFLELHASINRVEIQTIRAKFEELTGEFLSNIDVLIGSDVCFWDEMVKPVFNLMRRARRHGIKKIVIADPGRSPFRKLSSMATKELGAQTNDWDTGVRYKAAGQLLVVE